MKALVGAKRRPCTLISKLSNTAPGSSQDTMRRIWMGTGIWIPRIVSCLMEAVNSLKLESSITLCKSIIKIYIILHLSIETLLSVRKTCVPDVVYSSVVCCQCLK